MSGDVHSVKRQVDELCSAYDERGRMLQYAQVKADEAKVAHKETSELLTECLRQRDDLQRRLDATEPGAYPPSAVPNALRGVDLVALVRDAIGHKPLTIAGVRYEPATSGNATPTSEPEQAWTDVSETGDVGRMALVNLDLPGRLVTITSRPYEAEESVDLVTDEPPVGCIVQDSDDDYWRRGADGRWHCWDSLDDAREQNADGSGFRWDSMQGWAPFRFVE